MRTITPLNGQLLKNEWESSYEGKSVLFQMMAKINELVVAHNELELRHLRIVEKYAELEAEYKSHAPVDTPQPQNPPKEVVQSTIKPESTSNNNMKPFNSESHGNK